MKTHAADHSHSFVDPTLLTHKLGISAVKGSLVVLALTAFFQLGVALWSGSVSLLADTIHNFGDAATAIPLWVAFYLGSKPPTERFTYGYTRVEDFAGLMVIVAIFGSACAAVYISVDRLLHPMPISHWHAVALASLVGFIGNEVVAQMRIRTGKKIQSAALIADGYHARADGWTSLAVLGGAAGIALGYPLADSVIGFGIAIFIFITCWHAAKPILMHFLDAVDPSIVHEIRRIVAGIPEVKEVTEIRARWLGHRLHAEINIAVENICSLEKAHQISQSVGHDLRHHLDYMSGVTVHVDPLSASGERYHNASHSARTKVIKK